MYCTVHTSTYQASTALAMNTHDRELIFASSSSGVSSLKSFLFSLVQHIVGVNAFYP